MYSASPTPPILSPFPSLLKEKSMSFEGKLRPWLNPQMSITLDKLLLHWSLNFLSWKLYWAYRKRKTTYYVHDKKK